VLKSFEAYPLLVLSPSLSLSLTHTHTHTHTHISLASDFLSTFLTSSSSAHARKETPYNACPTVIRLFSLYVPSIFRLYRECNGVPFRAIRGRTDGNNRELLFNSEIAPRDTRLECWYAQMGPCASFSFHVSLERRHSIVRAASLRKFIVSLGKFDRD